LKWHKSNQVPNDEPVTQQTMNGPRKPTKKGTGTKYIQYIASSASDLVPNRNAISGSGKEIAAFNIDKPIPYIPMMGR
jgi:hypothetical protein